MANFTGAAAFGGGVHPCHEVVVVEGVEGQEVEVEENIEGVNCGRRKVVFSSCLI